MKSTGYVMGTAELERVHYFPRQLITADDMTVEQQYFRQRMRLHNRYLHGWGVVCGCDVRVPTKQNVERPWLVEVSPGYVLTPQGDEIWIRDSITFDLAGDWRQPHDPCADVWPCPPREAKPADDKSESVHLAVRYLECDTKPVRVHPVGCACDEAACEYSRIRDDFELAKLWSVPKSHVSAKKADEEWCKIIKKGDAKKPLSVPPPPEYTDEPWVVLASITLPTEKNKPIAIKGKNISYENRRVIYSVTALTQLVTCQPK